MTEPRAGAGKMQGTLKASFSENKNKGMSKRHTSQLKRVPNCRSWSSLSNEINNDNIGFNPQNKYP